MIILGIDPGTALIGYGLINFEPRGQKSEAIDFGCFKTNPALSADQRLKELYVQLNKLIKKYSPQRMAVEDIFFFKNLKTAIKVSQARGVILLTAAINQIPLSEYTPLQVKQAITGYGKAGKIQVQKMIKLLLNLKEIPKSDDAADALAIAVCCAHSNLPR